LPNQRADQIQTRHQLLFEFMRGWLQGRGYLRALEAMYYGQSIHTGVRKDRVTPEFSHQLEMAESSIVFADQLIEPEETFLSFFLHDSPEDVPESEPEILRRFGPDTTRRLQLISNHTGGVKKNPAQWYVSMSLDPVISVTKGVDRRHNTRSMVGVFTFEKQIEYIRETEEVVLPMLDAARQRFTKQEAIYRSLHSQIVIQLELIKAIHEAARASSQ